MPPLFSNLLVLALSASVALASPSPLKLDFEKRYHAAGRLIARDGAQSVPLALGDMANGYFINITVGTPGQPAIVLLDTGSSDLVIVSSDSNICKQVPADCETTGSYNASASSTYQLLSNGTFNNTYAIGSDSGSWITDTVAFADFMLTNQTIALSQEALPVSQGFGIMGVGYVEGESNSVPNAQYYLNVPAHLFKQGAIQRYAYSLSLGLSSGSILFGGIDTEAYTGELVSLPVQPLEKLNSSFTVDLTSVAFNSGSQSTSISPPNMNARAILDSGTTGMYLQPEIAHKVYEGLGAVYFASAQAYVTDCAYISSNATLDFQFGDSAGPTISMPITRVIKPPRFGNVTFSNGVLGCGIDLLVANEDTGYNNVIGDALLTEMYLVYDLHNSQIAMAKANPNAISSNILMLPSGTSIPGVSSTATGSAILAPQLSSLLQSATGSASATGSVTTTAISTSSSAPAPATASPASAKSPSFSLGVPIPTTGSASAAATSSMVSIASGNSAASSVMHVGSTKAIGLLSSMLAAGLFAGMLVL